MSSAACSAPTAATAQNAALSDTPPARASAGKLQPLNPAHRASLSAGSDMGNALFCRHNLSQREPHAKHLKPAVRDAPATEPVTHSALTDTKGTGKRRHTACSLNCVIEFVHEYGLYHTRDL